MHASQVQHGLTDRTSSRLFIMKVVSHALRIIDVPIVTSDQDSQRSMLQSMLGDGADDDERHADDRHRYDPLV